MSASNSSKIHNSSVVIQNSESLTCLTKLSEEAKNKFDVIDILFYHNTGFLSIGERIASIAVFARHRKEGFEALEYIINEMKKYH